MYKECPAALRMSRSFLEEGEYDKAVHHCKIIRYNPEEECIYLLAGKTDLPAFSLDGVYECEITCEKELIACSGVIIQRYWSKAGKVIEFQVKNGFYKKSLNKIK